MESSNRTKQIDNNPQTQHSNYHHKQEERKDPNGVLDRERPDGKEHQHQCSNNDAPHQPFLRKCSIEFKCTEFGIGIGWSSWLQNMGVFQVFGSFGPFEVDEEILCGNVLEEEG
jgi:hypothetical protein